MGEMQVPADAYYGASTQRAVLNFPISGQPMPARFIHALGMVKRAAAQTNRELGQSSNDVIPTAIQLASAIGIQDELIPALERLQRALEAKSQEFWPVIKTGRTHLQDATPIRLGQEFKGYAGQVEESIRRARG